MKGKPIECLSLYCLKLFIKRQFHAILCTVSNTTTGPDSKLNFTALGILTPIFTYGFFLLVWNNKLRKVHCIHQGVTGYNFQTDANLE